MAEGLSSSRTLSNDVSSVIRGHVFALQQAGLRYLGAVSNRAGRLGAQRMYSAMLDDQTQWRVAWGPVSLSGITTPVRYRKSSASADTGPPI